MPNFRLTEMLVDEVSVVDRGANQRRFLVVKRSDAMPTGTEVTQNADGTFTANAPAAAAPAAAAPAAGEPAPAAKQDVMTTEASKDVLTKTCDLVTEEIANAAKMLEGAKVVETEGEQDLAAVCEPLLMCAAALKDACSAVLNVSDEPMEGGEDAAGIPGETSQKRFAVLQAHRILNEAKAIATFKTYVEKVGSKMAKDRLARLSQAAKLLADVIGEVSTADLEVDKGDKSVKKSDNADVEQLKARVTELTTEVSRLRTCKGSNALPVDSSGTPAKTSDSEDFKWPMDMTRDLGRKGVEKSEDYFGENE